MGADLQTLITAVIAICLLAVIMRWTFSSPRRTRGMPVDAADSPDLGMLSVLAADLPREDARRLHDQLLAAGLRASLSRRRNGALDVLVFRDDLAQARAILGR